MDQRFTRAVILLPITLFFAHLLVAQVDDPRQRHFNREVQPILRKHCFSCHNEEDKKGGIALSDFYFINSIVRRGELWQNVVEQIEMKAMPPDIKPPMSKDEIDTVTHYINQYLQDALAQKDPGIILPRRLNNQEYKYVIKDLFGLDVDVDSIFPADPAGGAGFENHAGVLYFSPILVERYFETADFLVDTFYSDRLAWRQMVPAYQLSWTTTLKQYWYETFYGQDYSSERLRTKAKEVLLPFATLAYRRFLSSEEQTSLLQFFEELYQNLAHEEDHNRFDISIKETFKRILVAHQFLYRIEHDPIQNRPYPISNFELASRLSFFLWSSIPDRQLLEAAYREELHHPSVLEREVKRMLKDPRAQRLGEQFPIQWLELKKLEDPTFQIDPEVYPEFAPSLSADMVAEITHFFNHIITDSKNLLELIDSDYSFLNESLANHYGVKGVNGPQMRKVKFAGQERGGVLGMAGVLTATSLPRRTSPVLRGKWVLEQILGTPAPPPPPNVPELEVNHDPNQPVASLRTLLAKHRSDPACQSCHEAMDPIGLGLENFDGIGRWRTHYGTDAIDASGVLKSGESFEGPAELRQALLAKKELFAKNLSRKMLAFALGRSIQFKDSKTILHLQQTLLNTNFNSESFILELVKSYPFRYKKSDNQDVSKSPKASK